MKLKTLQDNLSFARVAKHNRTERVRSAHEALDRFARKQKPARTANGTRIRF